MKSMSSMNEFDSMAEEWHDETDDDIFVIIRQQLSVLNVVRLDHKVL